LAITGSERRPNSDQLQLGGGSEGDDWPPMMNVCASLEAVGIALEPTQRVIQVAVGAEHGILLTDAGIAYSWGDNRYGQLGRFPQMKEENGKPFPIEDLLGHEVKMVASGLHHCLALVAAGCVYSWGRNKDGQCGHGSTRDQVWPKKIENLGVEDLESPKRIVTIGAGGKSSVAAALDGSLYQWGEISSTWRSADSGTAADKERPHKVHQLSKAVKPGKKDSKHPKESISSFACKVIKVIPEENPETDKESQRQMAMKQNQVETAIRDQVETVRQLQEAVARMRQEMAIAAKRKQNGNTNHSKDGGGSDAGGELQRMRETIAALETEHAETEHALKSLERHLKSVKQQEAHMRKQLNAVEQQGTLLSNQQDDCSVKIFSKDNKERRKFEEQLADIRRLVEANKSTSETLDAQLKNITNETKELENTKDEKLKKKAQIENKMALMKTLFETVQNATNQYNVDVQFLKDQADKMRQRFASKNAKGDFIMAMKESEQDQKFLKNVRRHVSNLREQSAFDQARVARTNLICDLLTDLISMRRALNEMQEVHFQKDDLNLSCFVELEDKGKHNSKPKPHLK